ncbi:MAG: peptidase [Acidimicrobiales bacterium]|jgi:membrane-associated protease RseP (regulator of RpoE activity)|nr:peptidase [Acidimicrobiales bacterium]
MTTTTPTAAFGPETPENSPRNVAILVFAIAAIVLVASLTNWLGALVVIAALFAIIMLHEFGHFVMAKRAGMKVTEFFIGFGPRLWSVRRGETEYGVKALPLGGYVKIIGMSNLETVDADDEPRSYRQQSFGARLGVAVAGSTVHMILAFVLFWVLLTTVGVYGQPRAIREFTPDSAAQAAGLRVGDKLVSLDGQPVNDFEKLRTYVGKRAGVPVAVTVERGGNRMTITVTPRPTEENGVTVGRLGYKPKYPIERYNPLSALPKAAQGVGTGVSASVKALGGFFAPHSIKSYGNNLSNPNKAPAGGTSSGSPDSGVRFLSPLGIGQVADQAAGAGIRAVLVLLISINLFVGVFNMFPLLPLDGGHVVIAVYERVRSRRGRRYFADVRKMLPYSAALVMVLGFILVTSVYLDVRQPVNFFP